MKSSNRTEIMNITTFLLTSILLLHTASSLVAGVPQIINQQGKVSVGTTPFTGTGQFRFALVNSDGSTSFWSNDGTSTAASQPIAAVSLPVVNGLYVAPLGDATITNMTAVPTSVFNNADVRLRVWFNDGTNGSQLLSPDQRVTSVGYAMAAATLSPASAASEPAVGPAGSVYFNSTDSKLYFSNGSSWLAVGSSQAVYRWAVWSTYDQGGGWIYNNDSSLTGGVAPSNWSDNNAIAYQISSDKKVQAALFNKKAASSPNSVVWSETWQSYSSTNGKLAGALFRVRNKTGASINWTLYFHATAYPAWGEKASIALNGADVWNTTTDSFSTSSYSVVLSVPANRISTLICVAGGSPPNVTRTTVLAFRNNCLTLPAGLELVDDLDTASGGYEQ